MSKFNSGAIEMAMAQVYVGLGQEQALSLYAMLDTANPSKFINEFAGLTFNTQFGGFFHKLNLIELSLYVVAVKEQFVALLEQLEKSKTTNVKPTKFKTVPLAPTFDCVETATSWGLNSTPAQASMCMFNTMASIANLELERAVDALRTSRGANVVGKQKENFFVLRSNGTIGCAGGYDSWVAADEALTDAEVDYVWLFGESSALSWFNSLASMIVAQDDMKVSVALNSWDTEGNIVDSNHVLLSPTQLSDIIDHASELVILDRSNSCVKQTIAELDEAFVSYGVLDTI